MSTNDDKGTGGRRAALYPHSFTTAPEGTVYCQHCRAIRGSVSDTPECEAHPDRPALPHIDVRAGDVIDIPTGIARTVERFAVHAVQWYRDGSASIRGRYASNPRGIDWHLSLEAGATTVAIVSRGVSLVDAGERGLLPC